FINEDTYEGDINDPLSLNLYTYVSNNPLKYVDPSGHIGIPMAPTPAMTCAASPGQCKTILKAQAEAGKTLAVEGANFFVLDDVNTMLDPNSSLADKGLVLLGLFPPAKIIKAGTKVSKAAAKVLAKCNCFTAGTRVLTDEGEKPIEEIEVGDKVLAKDDETGEMAYKEVEWLFQRDVEETYNITVGGEIITTTDEHPFWIIGKGWVESKNLVVGDVLTTSDGKELAIEKIELKKEHTTVYNFMVKDFHTYFVSNLGIWTHNSCLPDSRWIQRDTYQELKRLGLDEQFDRAMKKGSANTRSNDNGIIFLSKNEQLKHKGNLYTYKLKVAKASNHVRVYGRIDDKGNLLFDYITKGK
ncbi:polymorphic toxin-type HINT domain-containing protein, partial [Paenibacillus sp. KS1]|uniref:polymorphic toxin-type HINT domain-containing protein n=1 Tax=Paenibacillus sp. KS1 TaxID=1849249 RepID=UPI000ACFB648